jgi:hypothetical protein
VIPSSVTNCAGSLTGTFARVSPNFPRSGGALTNAPKGLRAESPMALRIEVNWPQPGAATFAVEAWRRRRRDPSLIAPRFSASLAERVLTLPCWCHRPPRRLPRLKGGWDKTGSATQAAPSQPSSEAPNLQGSRLTVASV